MLTEQRAKRKKDMYIIMFVYIFVLFILIGTFIQERDIHQQSSFKDHIFFSNLIADFSTLSKMIWPGFIFCISIKSCL